VFDSQELTAQWRDDVTAGYAANWLRSMGDFSEPSDDEMRIANACESILEQVSDRESKRLTMATLNSIAALCDPKYTHWLKRETKTLCTKAHETLVQINGTAGGFSVAQVTGQALQWLTNPDGSFEDFLSWAQMVGGQSTMWPRKPWKVIREQLIKQKTLDQTNRCFTDVKNSAEQTQKRLRAMDELHQLIPEHIRLSGTWLRLARQWVGSLHAWPLLVHTSLANDSFVGVSLPVTAELTSRMTDSPASAALRCNGQVFWIPATQGDGLANQVTKPFAGAPFYVGNDWLGGLETAVQAASDLWQSQNGRLGGAGAQAAANAVVLVVDVTTAAYMNQKIFGAEPDLASKAAIVGRSAETYFSQVVLGLMQPDRALPCSAATGMLEKSQTGEWVIKAVYGIAQKLAFANASGLFSRVVIPRESVKIENYRELSSSFVADGEQRQVEVNVAHTLRTAADAMQTGGWRRARFFRALRAEHRFGIAGALLFSYDKENDAPPLDRHELESIEFLSNAAFGNTDAKSVSPVQIIEETDQGPKLTDELIGNWLGWEDHRARTTQIARPHFEHGLGKAIGLIVMRTSEDDSPVRMSAAFLQLAAAATGVWPQLRWGGKEQAAAAFASVFSSGNGSHPPPDLLVLIDDGGLTQGAGAGQTAGDTLSRWQELFTTLPGAQEPPIAQAIGQVHEATQPRCEHVFGQTRVVIIRRNKRDTDEGQPGPQNQQHLSEFDALAVFRHSFSAHQAAAVMQAVSETARSGGWPYVIEKLQEWTTTDKKLVYRRGRYAVWSNHIARLAQARAHADGRLHWFAACAFSPALSAGRSFLTANRDRMQDAEHEAEAAWHLGHARRLAANNALHYRVQSQMKNAANQFMISRALLDWDTVAAVCSNNPHAAELIAERLLREELSVASRQEVRHLARAITVKGRLANTEPPGTDARKTALTEAVALHERALSQLNANPPACDFERVRVMSSTANALRSNAASLTNDHKTLLECIETALWPYVKTVADAGTGETNLPFLSSDWLEQIVRDASATREQRYQSAAARCRLLGSSRDDCWLKLFALDDLPSNDLPKWLTCWEQAYPSAEAVSDFSGCIASMSATPRKRDPRWTGSAGAIDALITAVFARLGLEALRACTAAQKLKAALELARGIANGNPDTRVRRASITYMHPRTKHRSSVTVDEGTSTTDSGSPCWEFSVNGSGVSGGIVIDVITKQLRVLWADGAMPQHFRVIEPGD
jgi:hypothetical protein